MAEVPENKTGESGFFVRKLDIGLISPLTLYQKEVGNVSCVVWDAAIVLAKYLEVENLRNKSWLKGSSVVELGAGLGCVGLTASCLGAHVTMTDLPEIMPLMRHNIDVNRHLWTQSGGSATAEILRWGEEVSEVKEISLLLLADCVYYEESVEPLYETINALAGHETEIIICQELRSSELQIQLWKKFMQLLEEKFQMVHIKESEQHPEFHSFDICILRGKRKSVSQ
ncbi:protein N-lysine methyltransferase METTL21D-like [Schistocerca gregaria]|uniref:protein N-lysine methyltransferase METTL21D-like n=1 Tax=Schistocerca gregaria TaxID=7010 RepID=UPI00211E50A8|nr:protein N-lysine methyltransferase METTL21D-like [Schistocerca gregaria]